MNQQLRIAILILILGIYSPLTSQEAQTGESLSNSFIINIINPGIEYEWAIGDKSIFAAGAGIGYGGSYKELTEFERDGFNYIIAPFVDLQYKYIYNRKKRLKDNKSVIKNSGNFISFRTIARGWSIDDNVERTDDFDFAIGPTWGIQRSFSSNFRVLFDLGPQFYFDTKGNSGFFPIMAQLNIGFNIN